MAAQECEKFEGYVWPKAERAADARSKVIAAAGGPAMNREHVNCGLRAAGPHWLRWHCASASRARSLPRRLLLPPLLPPRSVTLTI
jgi:hypothetical protein